MIHLLVFAILMGPQAVKVEGNLIDPPDVLSRVLTPYVSLDTERLSQKVSLLGYRLVRVVDRGGARVLELAPLEVVRHVFIKGNWPLFENDVKRHVFLREGTRLPPPGPKRRSLLDEQSKRLITYLRHEGYFDGRVRFKVHTVEKNQIDLYIILHKGSLYRLGKLIIKGNTAVPADKIDSFFRHRILFYELPFYRRRFRKDIKKLTDYYKSLGYYQIRVRHDFSLKSLDRRRKKVDITLFIREGRKVEIEFLGKPKLSRDKLLSLLTFRESGSYDFAELRRSASAIVHELQKKGYYNAVVYPESYPIARGHIRILFTVNPGREYRIRRILFPGARGISRSRLMSVIASKVFPEMMAKIGLGTGGYITPVQARQDARKIEQVYTKAGYVDAKVDWSVRYDTDRAMFLTELALDSTITHGGRRRTSVVFTVHEGRRVVVAARKFTGSRPPERVIRKMRLAPGAPFSKQAYREDLKLLQHTFADMGHPYSKVEGNVEASPDGSGVIVTYRVEPGPEVRFGDVLIRGAFKTKKSLILKEITFKKGRPFSLTDVERSTRNMRSLGVFRSVRIKFLDIQEGRTSLPAVVEVVERYDDHGQVEIGGGFSTDNLYFASLAYRNKNVFGRAKRIEAKGEWGAEITSGRLVYQDPRFVGTRYLFDISTYYRREKTVRLGNIETYGLSTTIQSQWGRRFRWYARYEIRKVTYREDLIRISSGGDEDQMVNFATITGALGGGLVWDYRDNQLLPTRGWRLSLSARLASRWFGGDDDFVHLRGTMQVLCPLPFGMILAQGVRYDHGIPFAGTMALPKVERFYAGGDTTVRGYEEDSLFTVVEWIPVFPGGETMIYRVSPVGGDIRMISNTELQVPIQKHSFLAGLPLWGVLFFDTGYIVVSYAGFGLSSFHSSYGVALRVATPVGFLSLAYGIPLNPSWGTDPTGRIHFNFGLIF